MQLAIYLLEGNKKVLFKQASCCLLCNYCHQWRQKSIIEDHVSSVLLVKWQDADCILAPTSTRQYRRVRFNVVNIGQILRVIMAKNACLKSLRCTLNFIAAGIFTHHNFQFQRDCVCVCVFVCYFWKLSYSLPSNTPHYNSLSLSLAIGGNVWRAGCFQSSKCCSICFKCLLLIIHTKRGQFDVKISVLCCANICSLFVVRCPLLFSQKSIYFTEQNFKRRLSGSHSIMNSAL